ncbi:2-dehydropantoate 2-reductase [Caldalkalibacillus thermarum TA2.A1]|uniref:2-dehydropantoate 2-reductase n=1 Tax=Caldalkalibacillus thermarum (strain TA2.A1) TaxID=986075 RepID=F5L332_CALTT|nr:2-dehydropantoate 2-reductase [Caldalkalibacillus thermarum]EGL84250.1 2-dehydropantoate 2-reductase [Caldalkalibacillus thermarum TA2.A1]QZT34626.1 2-dehydropantoate 2-reductase [Caldalkalibacillus thermarum TA2.A1]
MRILVLGAGAVGGYFGGRLVENGADVTFLVRQRRAEALKQQGLVIRSIHGDYSTKVKLLQPGEHAEPFDVVIMATKAYHLDEALESVRPYIGEGTAVLPLLNGYAHMERLQQEFGQDRVLGGLCFIEVTLNEQGEIVHTSARHDIVFGEVDGTDSARVRRLGEAFAGANCTARASSNIIQEMWNKYIFITALSGMTTLFDSPLGPILKQQETRQAYRELVDELVAVAKAEAVPVEENVAEQTMKVTEALAYGMKSSMLRDMEKGLPVEADHLQGHFLQLARKHGLATPLLELVYGKLKVYELNRQSQTTHA